MGQIMCSYHPDSIAIDKCERCQRPICLIGKKVYHKRHSSGTNEFRRTWSTTHIYCPPCYADVATHDATGPGAIFGSVLFIIFGLFITVAFFSVAGPLGFFALIVVGAGIYQMVANTNKADEARRDEARFLLSLDKNPPGIKKVGSYSRIKGYARPDKPWRISQVSCFQCGEPIDLDSNYCMNCGESTKDEKVYYQK